MLMIEIKNKIGIDSFIKTAPFKNNIRKTDPHKHKNYFEIIYLSNGVGTHQIDQTVYQIRTPVVFFIRKEQVHHWNISSVPEGYVVILKKEFIEKSLDLELKILLSKLSGITTLRPKEHETIEQLFKLLTKEKNFTITEGLLKALFAKFIETAKPIKTKTRITGDLYQSYVDLLSKTDELRNSVSHYAKRLHTTPQNLSVVCKKNANQPAAALLANHIINEAKRQLHYTSNTVSEIAFLLGFNDSSHFIKYFKRHTGVTPQVFRQK